MDKNEKQMRSEKADLRPSEFARYASKYVETTYNMIQDSIDKMTNEQMTLGENPDRQFAIARLEVAERSLRALRETIRTLNWLATEFEGQSMKDRLLANAIRKTCHLKDYGDFVRILGSCYGVDERAILEEEIGPSDKYL